MKTLITLAAASLLLLAGCQDKVAADTETNRVWFGASGFAGFGTLIEIHDRGGQETISVYGTAPLHYEFPLIEQPLEAFQGQNAFMASFKLRGQDYTIKGIRLGGVINATINGATKVKFFAGNEDPDKWKDSLLGLYQGEAGRFLVTWREFGGLRAVNLETGENFTLLKTAPRTYFTWQGLESGKPQDQTFRFPKNPEGEIVALVAGSGPNTETFYKTDKINQAQISFAGNAGSLAGTILYPRDAPGTPGIVLVQGSGPIYRTALSQQAAMFAEMGFAVLVYDKRGTGQSQGRWQGASFEDLADDALAALAALEKKPFVDPARTGFQGHSQAGYILPLAATKSDAADFVIIVNGGSITPWQQSLYDKENDLIRDGFSEAQQEAALTLMRRVFAYVLTGEGDHRKLNEDYLAAEGEPWFEETDFPKLETFPSWEKDKDVLEGFKAELAYDPKVYQAKMKMPVLVLLGQDDKTVPADIVIKGWRETMAAAGNPLSKIILVQGAGHGMRFDGSGVFVPEYAARQKAWLSNVLGKLKSGN